MKIQKYKELSLLLFGTILGGIFILYKDILESFLIYFVYLAVILFLFGSGVLGFVYNIWILANRKWNTWLKKICIYGLYEIEDKKTSSWVYVPLKQIEELLKKTKIRYYRSKTERKIFKFPVVVNPYGGVYPENNIASFESLNKIFDYVKRGGIYVNIADIPFYYAFDPQLKNKICTTPFADPFSLSRSFFQCILMRKLHTLVVNSEKMDNGTERIILLGTNSKNFFDKKFPLEIEGRRGDFSPFLAISYGKGYFVFSTFKINSQNLGHITKIIKRAQEL